MLRQADSLSESSSGAQVMCAAYLCVASSTVNGAFYFYYYPHTIERGLALRSREP